jgi:hypothetical protein
MCWGMNQYFANPYQHKNVVVIPICFFLENLKVNKELELGTKNYNSTGNLK